MISLARTLLLDLDGTLIDTVPDLAAALNRLMAARGLAGFTPGGDRRDGGRRRRAAGRARLRRPRAARRTPPTWPRSPADYAAHAVEASRLYPGVADTLRLLAAEGWRLAVCTNKPEAPARTLLRAFGLDGLIGAIGGGDSFPVRKPDPRHLLATLAAAGGTPDRAVMVGDNANDVAGGHRRRPALHLRRLGLRPARDGGRRRGHRRRVHRGAGPGARAAGPTRSAGSGRTIQV